MSDPTFCRLYILTDEPLDAVQATLDAQTPHAFGPLPVEAIGYRNDIFDVSLSRGPHFDPIAGAAHTAEVGAAYSSAQARPGFQAGVVALVRALRDHGYVVTASCEFEDLIVAETGWNWTEQAPRPPGIVRP